MTIEEAVLELEAVGAHVKVWQRPGYIAGVKTIYVNSAHRKNARGLPDALKDIWGARDGTVRDDDVWVAVLKIIEDRKEAL